MSTFESVGFQTSKSESESSSKSMYSVSVEIPESSAPTAQHMKNHQENPNPMSVLELKTGRKTTIKKQKSSLFHALIIGLALLGFFIFLGLVTGNGWGAKPSFSDGDDDLRGQMISLDKNRSREVSSLGDELRKEISLLKHQMTPMRKILGLSSFATASAPPTVQLSTPRFFSHDGLTGPIFEPSPGWTNGCVNLPELMESVELRGHCLHICHEKNCTSKPGNKCGNFYPDSFGQEEGFLTINYPKKISSFRLCQKE